MKTIIHVNQYIIKSNRIFQSRVPPITVKTYKGNTKANEVMIYGNDGMPVAKVVYSPDKPLKCGATVWIETMGKVTTDAHNARL